jgi:hypothetical protein
MEKEKDNELLFCCIFEKKKIDSSSGWEEKEVAHFKDGKELAYNDKGEAILKDIFKKAICTIGNSMKGIIMRKGDQILFFINNKHSFFDDFLSFNFPKEVKNMTTNRYWKYSHKKKSMIEVKEEKEVTENKEEKDE